MAKRKKKPAAAPAAPLVGLAAWIERLRIKCHSATI
jgi:hypothetical protein